MRPAGRAWGVDVWCACAGSPLSRSGGAAPASRAVRARESAMSGTRAWARRTVCGRWGVRLVGGAGCRGGRAPRQHALGDGEVTGSGPPGMPVRGGASGFRRMTGGPRGCRRASTRAWTFVRGHAQLRERPQPHRDTWTFVRGHAFGGVRRDARTGTEGPVHGTSAVHGLAQQVRVGGEARARGRGRLPRGGVAERHARGETRRGRGARRGPVTPTPAPGIAVRVPRVGVPRPGRGPSRSGTVPHPRRAPGGPGLPRPLLCPLRRRAPRVVPGPWGGPGRARGGEGGARSGLPQWGVLTYR